MTETMARARRVSLRRSTPLWLLGALLATAVMLPLRSELRDGERAAFTVRNDTEWDLALHVRRANEATMPIITIDSGRTRAVREVLVPGDTWRFVWRFAGADVGESRVADEELRRNDFELVVPDEVERELVARDVPPSP